MTDGSQGGPPPGWYEDASRADRLRWWNGAAWTEDYRPVATDAAATVSMDVVGDAGPVSAAPMSRAQLRARRTADSDAAGSAAAAGEGSGVPDAAVGSPAPPSIAEERDNHIDGWSSCLQRLVDRHGGAPGEHL